MICRVKQAISDTGITRRMGGDTMKHCEKIAKKYPHLSQEAVAYVHKKKQEKQQILKSKLEFQAFMAREMMNSPVCYGHGVGSFFDNRGVLGNG